MYPSIKSSIKYIFICGQKCFSADIQGSDGTPGEVLKLGERSQGTDRLKVKILGGEKRAAESE